MFVNPDWNEYDPEKKYTHISKLQPNICTAGKWDGKPQYSNFFFCKILFIFSSFVGQWDMNYYYTYSTSYLPSSKKLQSIIYFPNPKATPLNLRKLLFLFPSFKCEKNDNIWVVSIITLKKKKKNEGRNRTAFLLVQ